MTTRKKDHLDQLIEEFVGGDINVRRLTQRQLARKVETTVSVICRMEQADYDGSLAMLRRITGALNQRLELRAVPIRKASHGMAQVGRKKLARG